MAKHSRNPLFLRDKESMKTLQELEREDWGDGGFFPSHLVLTCHALRRKRLNDFTTEDLRIMIGQNIGLPYLIPLAIEHLQQDPLATGDFYESDLLNNVLSVDPHFWQTRLDLRHLLEGVLDSAGPLPKELSKALIMFRRQCDAQGRQS